jgi:NRE family putative nickel resistance protein-like MFS transporter
MNFLEPVKTLRQPLFARLYTAQAISLLGDSVTWVGVALLAYEFGGDQSSKILATALTLRVTAFFVFGSYAGILADRFSRKKIMIISNLFRMMLVLSLVFVNSTFQLYLAIFLLNIFNAFFSPAYKACIPQLIQNKADYGNAIALSNSTWQLLGIVGPGLAGILATAWGARQIFLVDTFTFIISIALILFIPIPRLNKENAVSKTSSAWQDMMTGTRIVFGYAPVRFALLIELVSAIAGAQILVNTIGHIKGDLGLGDDEYGLIMSAFGAGATIAAFTANSVDRSRNRTTVLISGALMISLAVSMANFVPFGFMAFLWVVAGLGISWSDMPSQILIAENVERENQGKAYGSHFAWSHVWWATAYSLAGVTGTLFSEYDFLAGGIVALACFTAIMFSRRNGKHK